MYRTVSEKVGLGFESSSGGKLALEEMPGVAVPPVEADGVAPIKALHSCRKIRKPSLDEQVVVGH